MAVQHYGKGIIKGHYALCSCDECMHLRNRLRNERNANNMNIDPEYRRPSQCQCSVCKIARQSFANFFAAVVQVAGRRVAEKKAAREAKKQSNLRVLARAQFKATGAVLIGIEDRNGKHPATFHTTIIAGKVCGCTNAATGEECSGRHWAGHCCHGDRALSYEAARTEQDHEAERIAPAVLAEMARHDDVQSHVEDSIRSGEFVDAPQVPDSCDLCGRWSKRAVCPWCLGVAA